MGNNDDYGRGRADAAKGEYNPPKIDPFFNIISTGADRAKVEESKNRYDEGFNDKDREIKGGK